MNFSRKLIFVVGAAFLAACGDKVTVAAPTTPPPAVTKINSVDVAPLTATITAGQSITFTAAVNADAGVTYTTAWSTSNSAISVSSAGVVATTSTTVAGNYGVCAEATAGTQKVKGCATLVIVSTPAVIPASVSINSIRTTVAGTTVNPAAVAGGIDITLNVSPGNQTVTKIVLVVGGVRTDSQTFTAAQSAAMRYAADEAVAAQTTFPQIIFSVNTAKFNATTGVPTWLNGNQGVSAQLYTSQGGSASAATATAQTNLTFANANAFATTTTVGGTTAAVNNAAGFRYTKGDLTVSLLPVSYSGVALASGSVNFGTAACDGAVGPIAQRTKTLALVGSAWAATFANSGAAAAGNLTNYSFSSAACPGSNSLGEQFTVVAAQDASGNPFTTTALPIAVGSGYRMDNYAPGAPALNFTIASRRNALNWINDLPALNDLAAAGGAIGTAAVDLGTGGVGFSTTATSIYKTTVGGSVIASAAGLAESINNTTYSATATAQDLLGNTSVASGAATFGVDRTIPTFTAATLPADASVIAAPAGVLTGAIAYSDPATAPAGPSTPSATPVRMTIQRRTTATASTMWNAVTPAFNATGGAFSIGLAGGAFDPGATNVQGYYVVTLFVEDGAANASAPITRTYLYDITAPAGPFTIPVMTASAGASNLFSASLTDNIDLKSNQWQFEYAVMAVAPGGAGATLRLPATTFGSFLSFTTAATDAANYPLYRSMIDNAVGFVAGAGRGLLNVSNSIVDRGNNTVAFAPTAVPAVNLPAAATADPLAAAILTGFAYAGFVEANAAIPAAGNLDISGNATGVHVNSITLTATATGTVNTMINPFARVEFWTYDAVANTYRYAGQVATPSVVDNATNRVYTWTMAGFACSAYTCTNAGVGAAMPIIAVGVTVSNDAVRSASNATVLTQP